MVHIERRVMWVSHGGIGARSSSLCAQRVRACDGLVDVGINISDWSIPCSMSVDVSRGGVYSFQFATVYS